MFVSPQQSSDLKTLDYEAVFESMTNLKNTRSRGNCVKFTNVDCFQIGRYAGENGNKKALISFRNKSRGLKEGTVRTFKRSTKKSYENQDPRNDHLANSSKQRKEGVC